MDSSIQSRLTRLYGPAVRCKRFVDLVVSGLASMYPVSSWSCFAPDHHGYQRACGLISGQASIGPFGSPVFACAGKTEPPSRLILSQTSAGKSHRLATSSRAPHFSALRCRWRGIGIKRIGSLPDPFSAPRRPGHGPGRSRRCGRVCWQVLSPARCDAAASWPPRSRA